MDIQAAIDALPLVGGIVEIPVGIHAGPKLRLRSNVILQGQGWGTIIPGISSNASRIYSCYLRDLVVDCHSSVTTDYPNTYVIDWRRITNGGVHNVLARNGTYGLIVAYEAYYNQFSQLFTDVSVCGAEFSGGANNNSMRDGKLSAPKGLGIIGCNGTLIDHVALESAYTNMVYKTVSGDDNSTRAICVRQECQGQSSTYWNQ